MLRLVPVLVVAQDPSVWTEPTPMAAQSVSVSSDPTDVTRFHMSGERYRYLDVYPDIVIVLQ